jgi:hypothetical protein
MKKKPKATTSGKKPKGMRGGAFVSKKLLAFAQSIHKDEPASYILSRSGFRRVVRLAELAGKLKERQRTYPPGRRSALEPMVKLAMNFKHQLKACSGNEAALRKQFRTEIVGLTAKDYWVHVSSPAKSWKEMCGVSGWLVIDCFTLKTKALIRTSVS